VDGGRTCWVALEHAHHTWRDSTMLTYRQTRIRPSISDTKLASPIDLQCKNLLERLEEQRSLASTAPKTSSTKTSIAPPFGIGTNRRVWGAESHLATSLRILATHCCTATAVGVTCLATGMLSSAVAGAYLAGMFATCGFVGLELCRVRGNH
jgi:hypothetical protein